MLEIQKWIKAKDKNFVLIELTLWRGQESDNKEVHNSIYVKWYKQNRIRKGKRWVVFQTRWSRKCFEREIRIDERKQYVKTWEENIPGRKKNLAYRPSGWSKTSMFTIHFLCDWLGVNENKIIKVVRA